MHARWALASIGISNNSRSFAIKSASIMPAATVLEDTSFAADGLLPGTIAQGQVFWQLPHHPGKLLELELLFLAVFLSREGGKFMTPSFASCSSSCGISCRPVTQASQFKLNSFPCIRRMARWPQRREWVATLSALICLFPSRLKQLLSASFWRQLLQFFAVIIHQSKCWDFWEASCFKTRLVG